MALLKYTVGILSLLAGAAHAAPSSKCNSRATHAASTVTKNAEVQVVSPAAPAPPKLKLVPVSTPSTGARPGVNTAGRHTVPRKNLSLAWQTPNNDSVVSVGMVMQHAAVALEDVEDVAAVDCTGNSSVAVTFSSAEAFRGALADWSALNDSFVMITNHQGDCDAELERSFFVADSDTLASYADNLTIIALAERTDLVSTAASTSIDFASIGATPASSSVDRRGISWNDDSLTIAYNYSIPSDQTIVDTDYVSVTVNEAYVANSVTYSGHAKWELLKGVTEFYIDVDKSVDHYASMEVAIKGSYTKSFSWSPDFLTYSVIDIPGIISLGPSAGISIGGAITAAAEGKVNTEFRSQMPNGTIHVDFVDWDSSYSNGWETDYDASFNVTEDVSITLKPYIDFTVEFACKLFGGVIDLSSGIKAEPSFPFVTTATATQDFNATGAVSFPNSTSSTACANGLSENIDFKFDVIAFATKWVDITLYEYKADIWDGCLNFFGKKH